MDTTRTAQHWKTKVAQAIGKPELAGADDDFLDAAHFEHMKAITNNDVDGLPPAIAKAMGLSDSKAANARSALVQSLVKAKMAQGGMYSDYMGAFNVVRSENPHLFAAMHSPLARK